MSEQRKVAIVTGAARPWGMGREIALALARKEHDIAVVGADALARVAQVLVRRGRVIRDESAGARTRPDHDPPTFAGPSRSQGWNCTGFHRRGYLTHG